MIRKNHKPAFCDENPIDCHFDVKSYPAGTTVHNNDTNIIYLILCMKGHARITSTFFHDEILCAGEVMFVPRGSEYSGVALSDVTLLVHKFNNTVCQTENCILIRTRILIPKFIVAKEERKKHVYSLVLVTILIKFYCKYKT